jgi:hypothetical protein
MADASDSGPSNEVVITVEPARESRRGNEERRAETRNDASSLGDWLCQEAAWLVGQFLKVAISVRSVPRHPPALPLEARKRVRLSPGSGPLESRLPGAGSRPGNGSRPEWTRTATGPSADRLRADSSPENDSALGTASEKPKYITSIEGHHLYLHARRLHPAQQWPCPIMVQTPCRTCSFLEYDSAGRAQCVAVWKMKAVVHGIDGGESLDDVRDWIRNS